MKEEEVEVGEEERRPVKNGKKRKKAKEKKNSEIDLALKKK